MSGVVKFSEASSIALHALALLAAEPARHVVIGEIAERLPISQAHLAKVLQRLARAGLVESVRGPGGGFVLRGDPDRLTLLEVHEAIEGRLDATPCLFTPARCPGACIMGDTLREANALVRARLARTRLADVAHLFRPPPPLVALESATAVPARGSTGSPRAVLLRRQRKPAAARRRPRA